MEPRFRAAVLRPCAQRVQLHRVLPFRRVFRRGERAHAVLQRDPPLPLVPAALAARGRDGAGVRGGPGESALRVDARLAVGSDHHGRAGRTGDAPRGGRGGRRAVAGVHLQPHGDAVLRAALLRARRVQLHAPLRHVSAHAPLHALRPAPARLCKLLCSFFHGRASFSGCVWCEWC